MKIPYFPGLVDLDLGKNPIDAEVTAASGVTIPTYTAAVTGGEAPKSGTRPSKCR